MNKVAAALSRIISPSGGTTISFSGQRGLRKLEAKVAHRRHQGARELARRRRRRTTTQPAEETA